VPCDFFLAWGGVLCLVFEGFPPALAALKERLNEASAASGAVAHVGARRSLRAENFGSKWPKATLAATADSAGPLSFEALARLRRVCARHGAALRAALAPWAAGGGPCSGSVEVKELAVVHYQQRGLEPAGAPRRVPFPLLPPQGAQCDGASATEEAARVQGVLGEWLGDRLTAYAPRANQGGSRASSYREASPRGSTLVAFLGGSPPGGTLGGPGAGAEGFAYESAEMRGRATANESGDLLAAIGSFRRDVDAAFPGRFVWMDLASLHCTVRALDFGAIQ